MCDATTHLWMCHATTHLWMCHATRVKSHLTYTHVLFSCESMRHGTHERVKHVVLCVIECGSLYVECGTDRWSHPSWHKCHWVTLNTWLCNVTRMPSLWSSHVQRNIWCVRFRHFLLDYEGCSLHYALCTILFAFSFLYRARFLFHYYSVSFQCYIFTTGGPFSHIGDVPFSLFVY